MQGKKATLASWEGATAPLPPP